jgi:hypothetical protein
MALAALKQNKATIADTLPPTNDALFYHCLRVSRQVQIWLQAPDAIVKYPDMEQSGFQRIDGRLQIQWQSKLPLPNDDLLKCCGKHRGQCVRCACIRNGLACTIFCKCPMDCPNRKLARTDSKSNTPRPTTVIFAPVLYLWSKEFAVLSLFFFYRYQ